jgi:hypothetical protein
MSLLKVFSAAGAGIYRQPPGDPEFCLRQIHAWTRGADSETGNDGTLAATEAQVYLKADKASPAFTGTPTAPAAAVSVNSTRIATTAAARAVAKNDAWPVGSFYTQYPLAGQSAIASMFPSPGNPATLFGGTRTEMYAGEKVFFMGGLSSVESNRSSGIQEDAIRNITGKSVRSTGQTFTPRTGRGRRTRNSWRRALPRCRRG